MAEKADTDGAPTVLLGGKDWPIPILAARQNKIIDPLILSLLPIFAVFQTDRASALAKIGEKEYGDLQEIAFQALRRAHPDLTRDQFLDMPITLPELVGAFSVIAQQTGVFTRGEAAGVENPQTGTKS